MKKKLLTFIAAGFVLTAVYAYNPPAGGENLEQIASPANLSLANSVTGGALFNAGADSVVVNPALTAGEQRVNLTAGYTFLYSSDDENEKQLGGAFQTGILIPFKLYIFSGYINGTFAPFKEMHLGDSINFNAGLSKEITEKFSIGIGLGGGYAWSYGDDWALYGDVGALYRAGNVGFIKDFRLAASVLNLGKVYEDVDRVGIDEKAENSAYPTFATVKAGVAGSLLETQVAKIGLGFDVTLPCFQNLIVDMNAQISFKDAFVISIGEKFNLAEVINEKYSFIPSVAFLFKFSFDVKNNQYLENNGWSQSEMTISSGYKNLYDSLHAVSVGVDIDLGMADSEPPKIVVWDNE
ncbi:MAG: hypothetical protein J6X84_06240 [Treponema sp.]|nr:hypothetical protein [Treponema sp.]